MNDQSPLSGRQIELTRRPDGSTLLSATSRPTGRGRGELRVFLIQSPEECEEIARRLETGADQMETVRAALDAMLADSGLHKSAQLGVIKMRLRSLRDQVAERTAVKRQHLAQILNDPELYEPQGLSWQGVERLREALGIPEPEAFNTSRKEAAERWRMLAGRAASIPCECGHAVAAHEPGMGCVSLHSEGRPCTEYRAAATITIPKVNNQPGAGG